ncbi:protein phosphatase 2C domain-containing protein [Nakamurella sp.]|uniref:PP2C family protein-serine/threonine phosphatase n=1 Tax=Nakamurella sp. TaxID=1869182 RepID=UPI003785083C
MTHQLVYAARTDRGLIRANNQDAVFAGNTLLVVADGMGGHAAGDMASRLVVNAFVPLDQRDPGGDLVRALAKATREGNRSISGVVRENPELDGMGTTVTALLFDGGRLGMAHVGDSRAYLYRGGVLHQLTHDDTFVQSLIDDGRITQEEASHHPQRSLLLRALNGTDVDPALTIREVDVGDRYLICSDGLSGVVSAEVIAETLAIEDPGAAADQLVHLALVGGGPDNVTVIVADVVDTGAGDGPTAVAEPADPDATGPIGQLSSIRMTAEMPRIPLPAIPEESAAPPDFMPPDEDITAPIATAAVDPDGPPDRRRRRRTTIILITAVIVLGIIGLVGSILWVRSQYFVGENDGQVVVYRGVDGTVLGLQLSNVQEGSCQPGLDGCTPLMVEDLLPAARDQVLAGIQAGSLDDARAVIARLAGRMLPPCTTPDATPTPTPTPTAGAITSGPPGTATGVLPTGPAVSTAPGLPVPGVTVPGLTEPLGAGETNSVPTNSVPTNPAPTDPLLTTASRELTPTSSGTPLSTRAPEPGVTCRVVR